MTTSPDSETEPLSARPAAGGPGLARSLFGPLCGLPQVEAERARLEAFLSAFPGAYCGWNPDGELAYAPECLKILGIKELRALDDIQMALDPADAAALEGLFMRLQKAGKPFTFNAASADGLRRIRLTGRMGQDLSGTDNVLTLWVEDTTETAQIETGLRQKLETAQKSHQGLQDLLDHIPYLIWQRGQSGELVWVNRAWADALKSTPSEVIAEQKEMPVSRARKKDGAKTARMHPKDLSAKARQTGERQSMATHIVIDGKRRYLEFLEIPLCDENDRQMTIGVARDISREEELEKDQKRYIAANKELLEQLRTAIAIFSAEEKLEFYNSAYAQLWGLEDTWLNTAPKLGDIMEKLRETRHLPEQADFRNFKQSWLGMFTRLIEPYEDMLYLPDGSALRMLVVPHPMGGLMMTFEDVTSRLELESSYNTLIAVQRETLDNLTEGVVVFGGDGRIKLWNPTFLDLWDLHPEDLDTEPHVSRIAEKMKKFFAEKDWDMRRQDIIGLAVNRTPRQGRFSLESGTILEYATVPLPDGGVLLTCSDMTDSVRVETALREKNAALEAAEQLKLDFLANVSYQLRTPLSAIMGFAEILDNEFFGTLNARQKEYTRGMQEAGERLLNLINDILDLASIEAGYLALDREPADICKLLESVVDLTIEWARKSDLDLTLSCDEEVGALFCDERRLKQALINLIRNAITHTPPGGKIGLLGRKTDRLIEISVRDTGTGIPLSEQKRILEPFEKAIGNKVPRDAGHAPAPAIENGAGLGLTLVKNITELHGGDLTLSSAPGQGTTVTLSLPLRGDETQFSGKTK